MVQRGICVYSTDGLSRYGGGEFVSLCTGEENLRFQYRNCFFHSIHSFHRLISVSFRFSRFFHSICGLKCVFLWNLYPKCLFILLSFDRTLFWYSSRIHSSPRCLQSGGEGAGLTSELVVPVWTLGLTAALFNVFLPWILFLSLSLISSSFFSSCVYTQNYTTLASSSILYRIWFHYVKFMNSTRGITSSCMHVLYSNHSVISILLWSCTYFIKRFFFYIVFGCIQI